MKLGLLTAILGELPFEEAVTYASQAGFEGLEVACWPKEKAERRYAGVSHIDVTALTPERISQIHTLCEQNNITISALSYYPNILDADQAKAESCRTHLIDVIHGAQKLGVGVVGTFVGRDQNRSVDYNLGLVAEVWPEIIREAEQCGVRIAIENCPMLFTQDEWPGGQNLATSPQILRRLFEMLPSKNFGLNFDPSHFVWQQMDYIKAVYEFRDRIFHVHIKDIAVDDRRLKDVGVLAAPLEYMTPRIPGDGDVDWQGFLAALRDIDYDGFACLEIEDKSYEESQQRIFEAIAKARGYVRPLIR